MAYSIRNTFKVSAIVAGMLAFSSSAQAVNVAFDFLNDSELDSNKPAGTVMTRGAGASMVTMTTLEMAAPDFGEFDPYSNIITAGIDTNIENPNGLGINNPTINTSDFQTLTGLDDEYWNFNYLESMTFEFDQDVTFESIDFALIGNSGEFIRINIEGVVTDFDFGNTASMDIFTDPLSGLVITAGTDITITGLSTAGTDPEDTVSIGIDTFTVDVIPEPSSTALLGLSGLVLLMRRRK